MSHPKQVKGHKEQVDASSSVQATHREQREKDTRGGSEHEGNMLRWRSPCDMEGILEIGTEERYQ